MNVCPARVSLRIVPWLALGAASALAQAPLHSFEGSHDWARAGSAVAVVPDCDGDGVPEIAVGTPNEAPAGAVRVHSGRTGAVLRTWFGESVGAQFGNSIAVIGDLDGGGKADLVIGAPRTTFSKSEQGAVYLHSMEYQSPYFVLPGSSVGDHLGACVANVGDVDGDGKDEYAYSAPDSDVGVLTDCGAVVVCGYAPLSYVGWLSGNGNGQQLGTSIAAAGADFDGDGRRDVLVGSPGYSTANQQRIGRVGIYSVSASSSEVGSRIGTQSYEHFGLALAGIGDTDGDGVPEFVVGSPGFDGAHADGGRVQWFEGRYGAAVREVRGDGPWSLGRALACFDWTGDGQRELLVGAPGFLVTNVGALGAVRVLRPQDGALQSTLVGWGDDSLYGFALAGGLDFNGDGALELVVGAPHDDRAGVSRGCARLLLADTTKPYRYCSAKVNSAGCAPQIGWSGGASLSLGDNLHITATNVLAQKAGMLFWGLAQISQPFGGGTLCVAQPVRRTPVQLATGTTGCDGTFDRHLTSAELSAAGVSAGQRIYAQYWSRDPGFAAPDAIGLTGGLALQVAP